MLTSYLSVKVFFERFSLYYMIVRLKGKVGMAVLHCKYTNIVLSEYGYNPASTNLKDGVGLVVPKSILGSIST